MKTIIFTIDNTQLSSTVGLETDLTALIVAANPGKTVTAVQGVSILPWNSTQSIVCVAATIA